MRILGLSVRSGLGLAAAGCLTLASVGTTQGLSLPADSGGSGGGGGGGGQRWTAGNGNPTGGKTDVEYVDGKAIIPWSELEGGSESGNRSYLYEACAQLNLFWGSAISCRVVRPSFQRFYDSLAKEKARMRELAGNAGNVGALFVNSIGCFSDRAMAEGAVIWTFGKRTERTKNDFLSKVKTITVKYIDGQDPAEKNIQVEPFVELKGSDLILHVRNDLVSGTAGMLRSDSSGILHGCGWVNAGIFANFPEIKKVYDDYH